MKAFSEERRVESTFLLISPGGGSQESDCHLDSLWPGMLLGRGPARDSSHLTVISGQRHRFSTISVFHGVDCCFSVSPEMEDVLLGGWVEPVATDSGGGVDKPHREEGLHVTSLD